MTIFSSPPSQIELYKAEIARLQHEAWDVHSETQRTVTHLNTVLRRKNRRIKRQKDIIAQLKSAALEPRRDRTDD